MVKPNRRKRHRKPKAQAEAVKKRTLKEILLTPSSIIVALIAASSVIYRLLTAQPIDTRGDAYWIWRMCRELIEQGKPFAPPGIWDHRMLRWALSLPVMTIQRLFDASPASYYIWPILTSTLTVVFIYLIVSKLVSRTAGIFAAGIMMLYPEMAAQGSQIMPTGTAAMYVTIAIYCLLQWKESPKWFWPVMIAGLVFCGYGAKITTIFVLPGFMTALLYYGYQDKWNLAVFKPVTFFLVTFMLLFAAECLIFQHITTTTGGRIGCLMKGRHGSMEKRIESLDSKGDTSWRGRAGTLREYLLYFAAYHKYLKQNNAFLMNLGFLMAAMLILLKNKRLYLLAFIFIPAYLLFTYAVLGTYPFMRMERINNRYYIICYAVSIMMFVSGVFNLSDRLKIKQPGTFSEKTFRTAAASIVCLLAMGFLLDVPTLSSNVRITRNNYQKVEQARESGLPVLMKMTDKQKKDWNCIKRYRAFYGTTEENFYARPKAVKLSDEKGNESVYYVLEDNGVRSSKTYLLSSKTGNFIFIKHSQGD